MLRMYNGSVLSFQDGVKITDDELWIDGISISYVGPKRADAPSFEREIDLNGDLVMPSFKNAHTHSAMTFLRSSADDMPLDRWLNEQVFPKEAQLSAEAVYVLAKLAVMEYVSSGMSVCFDSYFHNDAYAKAILDSGFKSIIAGPMNNFDSDYTQLERDYLHFNSMGDRIGYRLGIHAEYTTCLERMEYAASLCEKYKAPFFSHNSETRAEVDGCIERYGLTPTALFDRLGMYKYGGGGFHCVHMSEEDIGIFKRHGLYVVLNPASNLKLASGIAPTARYLSEGIRLAIGTDGPASNNALDMFREMYLVTVLSKYRENDASACDADEVLKMACQNGARIMGMDDCDNIAVGKRADLVVIDMHRPNMRPRNNISKNIVYAGSKANVRLTMVDGRVLYENGEFFIGDEPERIYAEAERFVKTLR